jgi:hypothetical protein
MRGGEGRRHDDGRPIAGDLGEFSDLVGLCDHVAHVAAHHPVLQVGRLKQRRGRDDDRAELHRGEHDLPQRDDVAEHEQHVVAAPHPQATQPVRHLPGSGRHGRVADRLVGAVVADYAQRQPFGMLGGDHVEPVERPVELVERGPGEAGHGRVVVGPVGKQQVTRRPERARV